MSVGLPLGKNDSGKGFCEYHFNREVLLNTSTGSSDAEYLEGKQDRSYEKQNLNWVDSAEGGLKKNLLENAFLFWRGWSPR